MFFFLRVLRLHSEGVFIGHFLVSLFIEVPFSTHGDPSIVSYKLFGVDAVEHNLQKVGMIGALVVQHACPYVLG